jgi:hypothetical protein
MPPLEIAQNDLREPDPVRAVELESAIRAALGPLTEEVACSVLLVGFPRDQLRVELRGPHWCENLPLLPWDVPARTVAVLAEGLVERRRTPRAPHPREGGCPREGGEGGC